MSYFCKRLDHPQKWYLTTEKEALALLMVLEHFRVYVKSSSDPVIVYTYHNPLVFLHHMHNHRRCLMSWSLHLQEFNTEIQHITSRDNVLADALLRL